MYMNIYLKAITLAVCLLLLAGCWNSKELDDLGIVVAVGIDKTEDDQFLLVTQVINPSEIATDAPTTRPPVSIYETTGDSIFEAFRNMTEKSPRKMYLSQLRVLVIGNRLAEEGILPSLDIFYRDHEFRTAFFVTIAKDTGVKDLLKVLTPYEKIPANKLMHSMESVQKSLGSSKGIVIDELIAQILSKGQNPVLPGLLIEGDAEIGTAIENIEKIDAPTQLRVDHLAVMKEDRVIGWLTPDESKGLNYITGDMESTTVSYPCDSEGLVSVEVLRTDSSSKAKFEDRTPSISIELDLEGNVGELNCPIDLTKAESIETINGDVEKKVKQKMEAAIKAAQEDFGSDIFGFGSLIQRKNPDYWKTVEKDWNSHFKELKVEIQVKAQIRRKGNSTQPITIEE
ncbi:Ger(x)C family spore germination protein [Halobacillus trueperi]|uniref:Spore germination protein KC n=2 Tax=Halobacillus TaxID=45667 RepID=A0A1H0VIN2_HALAD|nr:MULTISPECIES: Ger(x)C family spore germination protein [Halobacillus]RDY70951.1 Ger(x)C family spore germination protein [Halobacillus trueperi]SDP78045.1 spore germination protein KC [Halobacillus aidingensis]